jgi:AAA domain
MADDAKRSVWARALAAPDFLTATGEDDTEPIVNRILVPGSLTLLGSPRGLGKSHVAIDMAGQLATGGLFLGQRLRESRVVFIDRDNPPRELRRRGTRWGWSAAGENLHILTRTDAPPLTDRVWLTFPFADYDVVFIDSVQSSTEGVDESSGGDSGAALAPLLDVARKGPAVLALCNTDKMGWKIRGSGVLSDRADIVLECRDATNLDLDARKDCWWESLPESGEHTWALRAKRRHRRDTYRLAVVPSKFRSAEEPDPFVIEISMKDDEPWAMREVTGEVEAALEGARRDATASREQKIADAVVELMHTLGKEPMGKTDAVKFLCDHGLNRTQAREKVNELPASVFAVDASKPGPRTAKQPALKLVKNEPAKDAVVTKEI